jgi:hypothetical protein
MHILNVFLYFPKFEPYNAPAIPDVCFYLLTCYLDKPFPFCPLWIFIISTKLTHLFMSSCFTNVWFTNSNAQWKRKRVEKIRFFFLSVSIHLDSLINTHMSNIYCNNIVKCLISKQKRYSAFQTLSLLFPLSCTFSSNSTTIVSHKILGKLFNFVLFLSTPTTLYGNKFKEKTKGKTK